jgi:hypothetical protein
MSARYMKVRDEMKKALITVLNHPGATRHPSLAKEGKFHDRYGSAI